MLVRRPTITLAIVVASLTAVGCGGTDESIFGGSGTGSTSGTTGAGGGGTTGTTSTTSTTTTTPGGGGAAPAAGTISIYVNGDQSDPHFADGLSGQTPTKYEMALARYEILRSADDPEPVLCFDHKDAPAVADMSKDNLVGACDVAKTPTAMYTHGRTKVDWLKYTVKGVYHSGKVHMPGKFTFFRAYSKTTYQGQSYEPNHGFVTFEGGVTSTQPYVYPPPVDAGGMHFALDGAGALTVTFPYTKPLPIVEGEKGSYWARFNWKVFDAFRWQDQPGDGYKSGVWDVWTGGAEQVLMLGVSGYYVTTSID
jgi:hypothetical protein